MTDTPLLIEQTGSVCTLTLNLPEKRNPISEPVIVDAFEQALHNINRDNSIRVVVITGAGKAFSSGGDVKAMAAADGISNMSPPAARDWYLNGIQRIPRAMNELRVPAIAAVNGAAIGAGLDLACMADIRIAAESAKFASSFVRLGIIPGDGGAYFLPRAIGMSRASEMIFTGELIDAQQAHAWGLVSQVVADDKLMDTAYDLANRIAANPATSLRMAKRLVKEGYNGSLDTVLELSAAMQSIAHSTPEHKEAVAAFVEKRPPKFD